MWLRHPLRTKRLGWGATLCVLTGQLMLQAQNSSGKRADRRTERQNFAALQEARRLGLKAELSDKQGKFDEAEHLAERALLLEQQVRGPSHIEVANRLDPVADLYRSEERR